MSPPQQALDVSTDNEIFTRVVNEQTEDERPENTRAAYDPKVTEFHEFCDKLFPSLSAASRYLVTPDKVYNFLFYQCYRTKRKTRKTSSNFFDYNDYQDVLAKYRNTPKEQWGIPE